MTVSLALPDLLPGVLHEHGVDLPPNMPFDQWRRALMTAEWLERASPWFLVDLIAYGRATYGEDYSQALPTAEDDPQGVRQAKLKQAGWMADKFPTADTRVPELTYSHHRAVAELEPGERAAALQEAVRDGLTTRALIERVRERQEAIRLDASSAYSEPTCAADRPWTPTLDDVEPDWRPHVEAEARGSDEFIRGVLWAWRIAGNESMFREWRD